MDHDLMKSRIEQLGATVSVDRLYKIAWESQQLDPREQLILAHARTYVKLYASAGIPGSNHILLIAKLAGIIDALQAAATETTEEEHSRPDQESGIPRDPDVRKSVG
jgi:hypothetical protein